MAAIKTTEVNDSTRLVNVVFANNCTDSTAFRCLKSAVNANYYFDSIDSHNALVDARK